VVELERQITMTFRYNYIKNSTSVSVLQLTALILLIFIFRHNFVLYFTIDSFIPVLSILILSLSIYIIINRNNNFKHLIQDQCDFRSFNYRYLVVKIIEIAVQQSIIIVLLSILSNNLSLFLLIFVGLHLTNYLYKSIGISSFFLLCSIPGALIFYNIYMNLGSAALGAAYFVHLEFYLIVGLIYILFPKKKFFK